MLLLGKCFKKPVKLVTTIALSLLIILLVIGLILYLVIPQLYESIVLIGESIPKLLNDIYDKFYDTETDEALAYHKVNVKELKAYFDEKNKTIPIEGYELNQLHPYDTEETEEGMTITFYFNKKIGDSLIAIPFIFMLFSS